MKIDSRYLIALLALGWQAHAAAQEVRQPGQPGAASTSAQETGYVDLMGGLTYTDNALLRSTSRKSDGIGIAGFDVDYQRLGELSLDLLGNLERIQYLRHSFGGSFYGHFLGSGVLGKPTDILQWQLSDSFGEESLNPLDGPTPQNLETINDFATGPSVNLHFGLTNRLTFFGLYSRTTYQRSPFDSQTYQGGAEFAHAISDASSVSLNASTAHTTYIESAAVQSYFAGTSTAYDIRQASISYTAKSVRADILLLAGYNTIRYGGASQHGAPLYQVHLSRQISPFSTVFVDGEQAYTTNGGSLGSPSAQIGLQLGASLQPGYSVARPSRQRSAVVGWAFDRARTNLSLLGNYQKLVFDQTSAVRSYDQTQEGITAILGRQLRPTFSVQLQAQEYWDRYSQVAAETHRDTVQLTFSKRTVRAVISCYVERRHQSGSSGSSGFDAVSYNDDLVGVQFTYDLFGERPLQPSLQGLSGPGFTGLGEY